VIEKPREAHRTRRCVLLPRLAGHRDPPGLTAGASSGSLGDAASGPTRGVLEAGKHTEEVFREWTGSRDLSRVDIARLPS
jgi:hypothetical protein